MTNRVYVIMVLGLHLFVHGGLLFLFFVFCMGCCQVFSFIVVSMSSCLQAAAFGSQDGLLTLDRLKSSVRDAVRQHGQKMVWETGTQR